MINLDSPAGQAYIVRSQKVTAIVKKILDDEIEAAALEGREPRSYSAVIEEHLKNGSIPNEWFSRQGIRKAVMKIDPNIIISYRDNYRALKSVPKL